MVFTITYGAGTASTDITGLLSMFAPDPLEGTEVGPPVMGGSAAEGPEVGGPATNGATDGPPVNGPIAEVAPWHNYRYTKNSYSHYIYIN